MRPGIGDFSFEDLSDPERLRALFETFADSIAQSDPALSEEFTDYHSDKGRTLSPPKESDLLVRLAGHLGKFLAQFFGVESEHSTLITKAQDEAIIFEFKKVCI